MITIREVGAEESELAARLALMENEVFRAPPVDDPLDVIAARIRAIGLGRGRPIEVLVAEDEGDPVGVLFFGVQFPAQGLRAMFYVKAIAVATGHQSRGIGRALLRHLCGMAPERGVARIDWTAWTGNTGAVRLYEALAAERWDEMVCWRLTGAGIERMATTGSAREM